MPCFFSKPMNINELPELFAPWISYGLHSPPGFTVMAFCEGRLASGTPTWLVGCHTLSLAGPRSSLVLQQVKKDTFRLGEICHQELGNHM